MINTEDCEKRQSNSFNYLLYSLLALLSIVSLTAGFYYNFRPTHKSTIPNINEITNQEAVLNTGESSTPKLGGNGGKDFQLNVTGSIKTINLWPGYEGINAIQIASDSETSKIIGSTNDSTKQTITLEINEFIDSMTVTHSNYALYQWSFTTTNGKKWGPQGGKNKDPSTRVKTTTTPVTKGALVGMQGTKSFFIRSIGLILSEYVLMDPTMTQKNWVRFQNKKFGFMLDTYRDTSQAQVSSFSQRSFGSFWKTYEVNQDGIQYQLWNDQWGENKILAVDTNGKLTMIGTDVAPTSGQCYCWNIKIVDEKQYTFECNGFYVQELNDAITGDIDHGEVKSSKVKGGDDQLWKVIFD